MIYKAGYRNGNIEILNEVSRGTFTLICDCGYVFDKKLNARQGLPYMCKRCLNNPSVVKDSEPHDVRPLTAIEQGMIDKFMEQRND